ncbi:MAG TPA: NUDIX domain-containing protein [Marmoricola sp.]|nr:NUDIX domain-containing protein [Marmoricola sp.]
MTATEEIVSLVDEHGRVVGEAPRSRMRAENLRHAATGVLLRDPDGRIYVHRRSPAKDWCPGCHDAAAGGVLRPGEQPEPAAERELAEELGVSGAALRPLLTQLFEDETVRCFEHVYEATYDGVVRHPDGEVVWGGWMQLPELGRLLRDPSWPFVPDTRSVLARLAREGVGDYPALLE